MPIRAALFDFDGVIADTENVHIATWQRTFGLLGWDESDQTCAKAAEVDDRAFIAEVFGRRKVEAGDVEGWARRKQELTLQLLADSPKIYPGVVSLIEGLRGRFRLGVVSTTWRGNIQVVLERVGLLGDFEIIVAKEDTASTKPDPEGYRLALDRLGLLPGDVVALEDSPTGLAAALGAGLRAIAVGHRRPDDGWARGATYLPNLVDVASVIAAIG